MLGVPYHGDIPDTPDGPIPEEVTELRQKLYDLEQKNIEMAEKARNSGQVLTTGAIQAARVTHLINFMLGVETEARMVFEIAFAETVRDSLSMSLEKAEKSKLFIPNQDGIIKPRGIK